MRDDNRIFCGVYPALVSPINDRGEVDEPALRELVRWLSSFGIDGLYLCGGTGEGLLLRVDERQRILEIVLDERARLGAEGRLTIIDHVGAVEGRNAEALARHAQAAGADAISAVPPIYYGYSKDDIVRYYDWLGGRSNLPFIVYASAQSGVAFSFDLLKTIAGETAVAGVKFTSYDFYTLMQLRSAVGERFTIFNGGDEVLLFGLVAGSDGGVGTTYNVMPKQFRALYDAFRRGDIAEAKLQQEKINRVLRELIKYPVIASVKAALGMIGLPVGEPVFPNRPLSEAEKSSLKSALDDVGFPRDYR
jgi:Dihydrodipicolinate synthase/N-acetylneuraminate lyase